MSTSEEKTYGINKVFFEMPKSRKDLGAFYNKLYDFIKLKNKDNKEIVIVCIGTDRSTGDSFGPLTGSMISKHELIKNNFAVYGTLEKPVHAKNIKTIFPKIKRDHPNAFYIAVDASVCDKRKLGKICLSTGTIEPGSGVGKDLPHIGDISITGMIVDNSFSAFMALQNKRLWEVYSMAKIVYNGLYNVLRRIAKEENIKDVKEAM